jgi:hypothetical protein
MLWTWQYRWMDKGMKLWCGETAGRRHAVEHVSSRQPVASSQLLHDAALQADGRPPSSSRPQPLVPAGRVRRGERGARRERCGSLQRCGARSGAEPATGEPWPRRALRRAAGRQGDAPRERPEGGQVTVERRAHLRGRATPPRASAEHGAAAKHGAAGAAAEQRSHR